MGRLAVGWLAPAWLARPRTPSLYSKWPTTNPPVTDLCLCLGRSGTAVARLESVKQQAVARFWELLQDFVALRVAPESWLSELAPDHPFLRVEGDRLVAHCVVAAPGAE